MGGRAGAAARLAGAPPVLPTPVRSPTQSEVGLAVIFRNWSMNMRKPKSGCNTPLIFPSRLISPVSQRKPRRLPPGVASFAEHAYRRHRGGAGMSASAELASQRHGLSDEDRYFLKTMIRAYEEQIADMMCRLIRDGVKF